MDPLNIIPVTGFHGTSLSAAESVLSDGFRISRNEYDWLGDGVYFFQDAPERAWEWAKELHGGAADVIGARIKLIGCLDLLDIDWFKILNESYDSFLLQLKKAAIPLPVQTTGAHRLDRAVINYTVGVLASQGINISTVRAAFAEGSPAFPGSALFDRSHVQIAVRDIAMIEKVWRLKNGH